jgi:hypothetical protein
MVELDEDDDQVAVAATPLSPQGLLVLDMTHRPRRSNPDTIQYLRQLPVLLDDNDDDNAAKEGNADNDDDDDDDKEKKNVLSYVFLQALREIRHELASVAGTEIGSVVLERMMNTLLDKNRPPKKNQNQKQRPAEEDTTADNDDDNDTDDPLALLWTGLSPYLFHLANHRYGSHVVQKLISATTRRIYYSDSDGGANADSAASAASHWIVAVAHNLDADTIRYWMTDPCASHVLRSLLAALAGRCYNNNQNNHDTIEKKNKKKKQHKKKRKRQTFDEEYTALSTTTTTATAAACSAPHLLPPPGFATAFDRLRGLIWDSFDDDWPYHTSACPVLLCLLQLMLQHYKDSNNNKNRAILIPMPIIQKISSSSNNDQWMYDPTASRFWQALVETSADSSTVQVIEVVHQMAVAHAPSVKQYIQHDIANYCVQTMLEHHYRWIDECLKQLPYLLDLTNQRRGVVWKLAVAICRGPQQQQQQRNDHIDTIVQAIQSYGLRRFALEGGPPSLSTLLELRPFLPIHVWTDTPTMSSSSSSLMNELCRHSLASQILLEPWIEQAKERFPLPMDDVADLARHPVGHHVLAKYVLTTRTVPDRLLQLLCSSSSSQQRADQQGHPVLRKLLHERLQLPLYQEKGAKAWRKALFGSSSSSTVVVVVEGREEKDVTSPTGHRDTKKKKRKKMRNEKGTK